MTQTAAIDVKPTSRPIIIGLCFLVALLEGYDIQAMGVTAPKLAPALSLAPSQLGLVFAISNFGLVVGASFGGWLADKIGRKPVFIASVVAFGVFTLATTIAHDFTFLFGARFMTGLGLGAALPNMIAIAAEVSRPDQRSSATTTIFCGMPIGGALSAMLVGTFRPDYDWRVIFLIGGLLPLLITPLIVMFMKETASYRVRHADGPPHVLNALFADGRAWPTLLLWATFLPTLVILYLLLNWLPTLAAAKGLPKTVAPQAATAFNLASVVGALLLGQLVDRIGFRWPVTIAYIGLIASVLLLAQASGLSQILLFSGMAGFCVLGAQYSLYGVAASYYPQHVRGIGSGFVVAVGRIGSILGPLIAGQLLSTGKTADQVIATLGPVAAVAGIAVFLLSFFPARKDPADA